MSNFKISYSSYTGWNHLIDPSAMLLDLSMAQNRIFDLEERTAVFGENILLFLKKVPANQINNALILQLARAGTSVGANYSEADDAVSKKDFRNKIGICKKESRECKHFLRMIWTIEPVLKDEAKVLWQEAKELNLIFNAIFNKLN